MRLFSRCAPCRNIAPVVEQYATRYPNAVFLKVDVDKCIVSIGFMLVTVQLHTGPRLLYPPYEVRTGDTMV